MSRWPSDFTQGIKAKFINPAGKIKKKSDSPDQLVCIGELRKNFQNINLNNYITDVVTFYDRRGVFLSMGGRGMNSI